MALEKELKAYREKLGELLADHQGKYALVFEDNVVNTFAAYEDAIKAGYDVAGTKPFLVKKIESDETVFNFTRDVKPCRM